MPALLFNRKRGHFYFNRPFAPAILFRFKNIESESFQQTLATFLLGNFFDGGKDFLTLTPIFDIIFNYICSWDLMFTRC
jgi:hypothetical protein